MISLRSPFATRHGAPSVGPMPGALRDLALGIGTRPLAGLTAGGGQRLVSACHAFAGMIEADSGADARFGPCFLVSALCVLRGREGALPLSDQDEAWMISEVESELGEARARMDARAGRSCSARPALPVTMGETPKPPAQPVREGVVA